jgi:hypothetical protein
MVDVRFATEAMLTLMGLSTKKISPVDFLYLIRFKVPFEQSTQIMD